MRIMIVASYADSLMRFRGELIEELIERGNEVIACAPDLSGEVESWLKNLNAIPENVPLVRTGLNPVKDLYFLVSLCRVVRRHKPDLVLTYTAKPNIWGSVAAKVFGTSSVAMVTGLGFAFTANGGVKQKIIGLVARTLFSVSTSFNRLVIFQNKDDAEDFHRFGCIKEPKKIRFVNGSGVNLNYYFQADMPKTPVFLLIARLLYSKGIIEYAEAASIVKKRLPNTEFLLAGFFDEGHDGLSMSDIECVEDLGVKYIGELKDVRGVIERSSIYVLPSYREGTPRSVLEAMSMGRSIITTDVPGCRATTVDGVNGFLVPARNVEKLAEKMHLLASNSEIRRDYGAASRKIAEDKYAVEKVNSVLIGHLLEANSKPS